MMNLIKKTLGATFLPVFGSIGFILIYFQNDIIHSPFLAQASPTALVIIYAIFIGFYVKGNKNPDIVEHHAESIYFLGFLFTLVAIFSLFSRFDWNNLKEIEEQKNVVNFIGIALLTTIFGIVFRNIIKATYMQEEHESSYSQYMNKMEEIKRDFQDFSNRYEGIFITIGKYIAEREKEIEHLHEKEKEYFSNLDNFNSKVKSFSNTLVTQQKSFSDALISQHNTLRDTITTQENILSEGIKNQQEAFKESTDILENFEKRVKDVTDSLQNSIGDLSGLERTMRNVAESITIFNEGVTSLKKVLDDFIKVVEHKVTKLKN